MVQPDRRGAQGEIVGGQDPLDYWLAQERNRGLDETHDSPAALLADAPAMPGGWWIVPVLVMALPVWAVVVWILVRR